MISIHKELKKHAKEFIGALRNFKYEKTESGIFFPGSGLMVSGEYAHTVNGQDLRIDKNLITDEGLTYMLGCGIGDGTKITTWYLALFAGGVTPAAGWTAANFAANASEITSTVEGHSETVRQLYVPSTAALNVIDNMANKATFTIVTSSSLNVTGAGLLSSNVRGGTTGKLVSATRFSATRVLANTDEFALGYRVQAAAV